MKNSLHKFLRNLIIFTFFVGVLSAIIWFLLPEQYLTSKLVYIILFFFSVTLVSHVILLKGLKKRAVKFINVYMLLTMGRLLFFLTLLLIYIFVNREDAVPFSIAFLIMYFLYSGFDVSHNMRIAKKKDDDIDKE